MVDIIFNQDNNFFVYVGIHLKLNKNVFKNINHVFRVQVVLIMSDKINKPCYFYNTGGCYNNDGSPKTADQCKYLHIKVDEPLEKPQHLKPPCKFYHLRRYCRNVWCIFGHAELSKERWEKYFPQHPYPGGGYGNKSEYVWDGNKSEELNNKQIKATILMLLLQLIDTLPEE